MADDIPIKSVDAIKQYIDLTKKMIERIKRGDIRRGDPSLQHLEEALKGLQETLRDMGN
jgi:hypothetical protein